MKIRIKITLTLLTLGTAASLLLAQDGPPQSSQLLAQRQGPEGRSMAGQRPPPAIIATLDANHDGVIDADEIGNASSALMALDKNGDGKLTRDELQPPRPDHMPPHGPRPADNGADGEQGDPPPQPNQ